MDNKMFYVKVKKTLDGNNIDGDGRVILTKIIEEYENMLILREYGVDEFFIMKPTSERILGKSIPSTRCVVVNEEYAIKEIYRRTKVEFKSIKNILDPLDVLDMYPSVEWYLGR